MRRVRNSLGYADVDADAEYVSQGGRWQVTAQSAPRSEAQSTSGRPRWLPAARTRNALGYGAAPDFDSGSSSLPGTRDVFTFAPAVVGGSRGYEFAPSDATAGGLRVRPFATLPAPGFFPRGGSPAPLDLPRITPAPRDFTPRGGTPAPAPGVTRMWNVSPAIPGGTFRPVLPEGAQVPEVFTAPDGRRWYIPPQPRRLPGDWFWQRLLNLLRGGRGATTPSTATVPSSAGLLPAYDLFQPGVFGPGIDATTEDPALAKVKEDESKGFPFLPVLLLGGGAFLAYRVVRKKGAQGAKP